MGNLIYAVKVGRQPGIYHKKKDAMAQVQGFCKSEWRSFKTDEIEKAKKFIAYPKGTRPIVPYGFMPAPYSPDID